MKILRVSLAIMAIYLVAVLALGILYRFVAPPSTLMLAQWAMLERVRRESVSLAEVSPNVLRAIIRAEDSKFCTHSGVDWDSMSRAMEENRNGKPRGASTISMQVAKNLFLVPHRSYARKALEIPIAIYLDFIWPKERMMEVYLSIAEWGEGIYGVEAATQAYFHKSANKLTPWESSLLAAALPNPLDRPADKPSSYQVKYAGRIQGDSHAANISCLKQR